MSYLDVGRERIKQRLALYRGVRPIYMQLSDDAEETFSRALKLLVVSKLSATSIFPFFVFVSY